MILLLSVKSGLRAKEIASITWQMVTDPEGNIGDAIALQNVASKGKNGGRMVPLNKELKAALETLKDFATAKRLEIGFPLDLAANVVTSERGERMSPNSIAHWFKRSRTGSSDCMVISDLMVAHRIPVVEPQLPDGRRIHHGLVVR